MPILHLVITSTVTGESLVIRRIALAFLGGGNPIFETQVSVERYLTGQVLRLSIASRGGYVRYCGDVLFSSESLI